MEFSRISAATQFVRPEDVDEVLIGRGPERHVARVREDGRRVLRLTIPDRRTSREHAKLVRTPAGWTLEDLESKNGSVLNRLRVSGARRLASGDLIELGHTFFLFQEHVPTAAHDPADLVAISPDVVRQLEPILLREPAGQREKWLAAPVGTANQQFLEALRNFMYWENYDVRVRMDGKIDRVVLADILSKHPSK